MNFLLTKSVELIVVNLIMLLTACVESTHYAPVKTVNEALEPKNGFYLRIKSTNKPNGKMNAIKNFAKTFYKTGGSEFKKQNPDNNREPLPKRYQNNASQPNSLNQDGIKQAKNTMAVTGREKSQPPKATNILAASKQLVGSLKNKSIISKTNSSISQKKQAKGRKPLEKFQKNEKNKKSIISIDNKKVLKLNFQWPIKGKISRNFPQTDHKGILIRGKNGQAVHAAEAGKAVYCGHGLAGFGNLAIIKHNGTYLSAYANTSKLFIKEGEQVKKGQKIGQVGLIGLRSSSLHFEIRKNGKPINPLLVLPKH
jgi:murein DD-endopeptidase MepM/ murein hydrolase activator NlpD